MKRITVVEKITRYEHVKEQLRYDDDHPGMNKLKARHDAHHDTLAHVEDELTTRGIDYQVLRIDEFADPANTGALDACAILSCGGDGTYLSTTARVVGAMCKHMPVFGINTDPSSSTGALCLSLSPTGAMHLNPGDGDLEDSLTPRQSLQRLLDGEFRWLKRTRIRVQLSGGGADAKAGGGDTGDGGLQGSYLALNDVLVAENESYKVTKAAVTVDGAPPFNHKGSGLLVSTGSGSSSWSYNELSMCKSSAMVFASKGLSLGGVNEAALIDATARYNRSLIFDPEIRKMRFVERAPSSKGGFKTGFASTIQVAPNSWNCGVSLDGYRHFDILPGQVVEFSVHDEDSVLSGRLNAIATEDGTPVSAISNFFVMS